MDHRCGIRHQMGLLARLHVPGRVPMLARARDASLGGVFVETRPSRLAMRAMLEVELLPPGESPPVRLPAMVVRKTADGVGLMFDDFAPRALSRLLGATRYSRELFRSDRPAPARRHRDQRGGH